MFDRSQIQRMLTKFRAECMCAQCGSGYQCSIYDAAKSSVGHLCKACKNQVTSLRTFTSSDLWRVFDYDAETGFLTLRNDSSSGMAGDRIGYGHGQGYLTVLIGGKEYLAHRVIWLMQTGSWPTQVDHINHDRSDNRWLNLRDVSPRENQMNMGLRKNSSTGVTGVRQLPSGKYQAFIMVHRKQLGLGTYVNISDAASARKQAEARYGFHVNHGC